MQRNKFMTTENLPALTDEYCLKEFGWTKSRFEVIQRTYFKGLSMDDIAVFGHVCKHVGLDPFLKQIYPVVRDTKQKDGTKKPTMSIQTGIDGYRAIAERTGKYSPGKEPLFRYDKDNRLFSATAYVMKMTNDGKWHEVAATAIMKEYLPTYTNDFWGTKPHIMLSKCAEALALRKAFPAELSGVYTKEEMDQAGPQLEETQCEEINNDKATKEGEVISLKIQPDTNMNHFQDDTNMKQEPEPIPDLKIAFEDLMTLVRFYDKTSQEFRENFDKNLLNKLGIKELKDLPAKYFHASMTAITRNIELQESGVINA
jgi:phage recombination protein Bet